MIERVARLSVRGTRSGSSGVSKIALLVIVLILLVLSSLLVVLRGKLRAESRRELCRSRLRTLGKNFEAYSARYGQYPTPGPESWFDLLLTSGIAANADEFTCPFEALGGVRGRYLGIIDSGSYSGMTGSGTLTWTKTGIFSLVPGLPLAADRKLQGVTSHGDEGTRFILEGSGQVLSCAVGSPSDWQIDRFCKEGWFGFTK